MGKIGRAELFALTSPILVDEGVEGVVVTEGKKEGGRVPVAFSD